MDDLSPRQATALEAIRAHIAEHGFAPTERELGALLGVARGPARRLLACLVTKGALRRSVGTWRGLALVGGPNGPHAGEREQASN